MNSSSCDAGFVPVCTCDFKDCTAVHRCRHCWTMSSEPMRVSRAKGNRRECAKCSHIMYPLKLIVDDDTQETFAAMTFYGKQCAIFETWHLATVIANLHTIENREALVRLIYDEILAQGGTLNAPQEDTSDALDDAPQEDTSDALDDAPQEDTSDALDEVVEMSGTVHRPQDCDLPGDDPPSYNSVAVPGVLSEQENTTHEAQMIATPTEFKVQYRDNDYCNLRDANLTVTRVYSNHSKTSKFQHIYPRGKTWYSLLCHQTKRYFIGRYGTEQEAAWAARVGYVDILRRSTTARFITDEEATMITPQRRQGIAAAVREHLVRHKVIAE